MYGPVKPYYDYLFATFPALKKHLICAHALEPYYYFDHPDYAFDRVFENRKVLVISSHKETVKQQINKDINSKFAKPIFHGTTQYYIYKPTQQNAWSHDSNSWIYHFEAMKNDLISVKKEFDYDIALVSAGGFGILLCDYIFTTQKVSILYVGGALQLFFGIIGGRWKSSPKIMNLMNQQWTETLDSDKPQNVMICEGIAYW